MGNIYRGFFFKLGFNIPYATSLYLTAQGSSDASILLSWFVTAALYPLTILKVKSQLLVTDFSIGKEATGSFKYGIYRGLIPFLLINAVFGWTLRPLFS